MIAWALSPLTSHAAVTLIYFRGHGMQGFIRLEWATATELDNAGFYILRSDTDTGSYTRISQFIPTGPDSITGYQYSYIDSNVVNEIGYWYQLEMVDTEGESTYDGPIQVIAGVYATEAPTATTTATMTIQAGSAATATRTSTPTRTRTPTRASNSSFGQITSTFSQFSTATSSGLPTNQVVDAQAMQNTQSSLSLTTTMTATATLIPVPEIAMQFPTDLAESVISNEPADSGEQNSGLEGSRRVWFTLERLIFLGFILLMWVLLAGWFYLSYRRTEE